MPASHVAGSVAGRAWWCSPRRATMLRSATSFKLQPTSTMWRSPHGQPLLQQPPRPLGQVCSRRRGLVVAAARDPYDLLGVPRTATMDEIKRAYRKKALKLHPDVNKAPDAKERFMECKNAYQQLLDAKQGRGGGAGGSSAGAAGGWGSAWGGSQSYGSSRSTGAGQGRAPPPPEETYSFGDLFDLAVGLGRSARSAFNKGVDLVEDMLRDLEKEFSEYSKEKQSKAGGSGSSEGGRMKSLWEELADIGKDIGEELVEFLEQELGLSDDDGAGSKQRSSSSSSSSTASSGASSTSSQQQQQQAPPPPPPPKKSSAEEVEDELAALKRKLGMK